MAYQTTWDKVINMIAIATALRRRLTTWRFRTRVGPLTLASLGIKSLKITRVSSAKVPRCTTTISISSWVKGLMTFKKPSKNWRIIWTATLVVCHLDSQALLREIVSHETICHKSGTALFLMALWTTQDTIKWWRNQSFCKILNLINTATPPNLALNIINHPLTPRKCHLWRRQRQTSVPRLDSRVSLPQVNKTNNQDRAN